MFLGMGFGGYVLSILISWVLQRHVLTKVNESVASTLIWVLWIPMANIIISLIFLFASNQVADPKWIKKTLYQIKD